MGGDGEVCLGRTSISRQKFETTSKKSKINVLDVLFAHARDDTWWYIGDNPCRGTSVAPFNIYLKLISIFDAAGFSKQFVLLTNLSAGNRSACCAPFVYYLKRLKRLIYHRGLVKRSQQPRQTPPI